jgi:bis(5'-nucleosyl)-tetraphosphatase (symmetrical)
LATYIVGDLQGCYAELLDLLELVAFDASNDQLVLAGDLVNRGPQSLECLRFAMGLGERAVAVLGNHDLHLLAASAGARKLKPSDTLNPILQAPDRAALLAWLTACPLAHWIAPQNLLVVHAGVPPAWTLGDARQHAAELETVLRSTQRDDFLHDMYGNSPGLWQESLSGHDRLRFITNALTRMRYVSEEGHLDMEHSGPPGEQPGHLVPWFAHPERATQGIRIAFGHWATLQNKHPVNPMHGVFHLDTGCVWGGQLTALRAEDSAIFTVPSRQPKVHRDC